MLEKLQRSSGLIWATWLTLVSTSPASEAVPPSRQRTRSTEVLALVVSDRLVRGYRPGLSTPGEVVGVPLRRVCLGVEGKDASPELVRRLAPLEIVPISQCPEELNQPGGKLEWGTLTWTKDVATVTCDGLGTKASYRAIREGGRWKVGIPGGLVS